MITIKTNDTEYYMPENYDEMTLNTFIRLTKVQESNTEYIFQEYYMIKLLEAMVCAEPGDLDELTIEEMADLSDKLKYLSEEPKAKKVDKITIGEITYAFPENFNKLTTGELISIRTLNDGKGTAESILNLLAIVLRPATKHIDAETGKEKWIRTKFDAQNIEYRKSLFGTLPVLDCLYSVNFFFTGGSLISNDNTQVSTTEVIS